MWRRFVVGNVLAHRVTEVNELAKAIEPIGIENSKYIAQIIGEADILVSCWGKTTSGDPLVSRLLGYTTKLIAWNSSNEDI